MSTTLPGATWGVIIAFIILALGPTIWYVYHVVKDRKK